MSEEALGDLNAPDSLDIATELDVIPKALAATVDAVAGSGAAPVADVAAVVVASSAESLVTAAMVSAIAANPSRVPMVFTSATQLPEWVDSNVLVLALDTQTADALNDTAAGARAHLISLGAPAGSRRSSPILESAAALAVLDQLGVMSGVAAQLSGAVEVLESRAAELLSEKSPAARLARRIGRTMPIVYGAGPVGAAAGRSWKASVNRNGKAPSFTNAIPGLDYDEIAGWAQHGDVTRQVFSLVVLQHGFATESETRRLIETSDICDEIVGGVYEVATGATSPVAAMFDLALYGEYVSLEMAAIAGIDPGPLPVLDRYSV